MKYIHIMSDSKFLKGTSRFYNKFFSDNGHELCYINYSGKDSLIDKEFNIPQTEFYFPSGKGMAFYKKVKAFIRFISDYDYIVFHSLFFSSRIMWQIAFNKKLTNKLIWIEWGADLYNWDCEKRHSIQEFERFEVGYRMRNNCNTFVGIFPPDCDFYRAKFPKSTARVVWAPYCSDTTGEEFKNYKALSKLETLKDNEPVMIQIGHSAARCINHLSILKALGKFKDENIKLLIPLSYGDSALADTVQNYAESVFGEKAMCLREFMPKKDYFELLSNVSIAIFDTERQIALGNISQLIFKNVKIYLKKDSVMYKYFKSYGVPVQATEDLDKISFEDLKKVCKIDDSESFNTVVSEVGNMDHIIELWKSVYSCGDARID